MAKLIVLQGLPASWKSSKAKIIFNSFEENKIIRLNRDLLREMMHFGEYSKLNEREVMNSEKVLAQYYLQFWFSVIIDDTNLKEKNLTLWKDVAEICNVPIEIIKLDTSLEECIKRDKNREKSVWEEVIRWMIEHNLDVDSHYFNYLSINLI